MANFNLDVTYKFAVEKFSSLDPKMMAENSNTIFDAESSIFKVNHISKDYIVTYPQGDVSFENSTGEISMHTKILILHYLSNAKGVAIQNKEITYKELPDGAIYITPFTKRTIKPMLDNFGDKPLEFLKIGQMLGGRKGSYGDVSVTINVFPNIPITYVIWEGDDEFPPSGNILFDSSAKYYLPTEDYAFVTSMVIWAIKGIYETINRKE